MGIFHERKCNLIDNPNFTHMLCFFFILLFSQRDHCTSSSFDSALFELTELLIKTNLLLSVIQNGECFRKSSIFFISCPQIWLIHFLEIHLIIFYGQKIISNDDVLNFELVVHLLLPSSILLSVMSNHYDILFN